MVCVGDVLGASWGRHGVSWGAPGCLLGPLLVPKKRVGRPLNVLKTMHFTRCLGVVVFCEYSQQRLCVGPFCNKNAALKGLGGDLGSLGSLLGASWGLWGRFWAPKGPPGGILGAPWGILGPPRGLLGASLGPLGASWRPPGGLLGATLGAPKGPSEASER